MMRPRRILLVYLALSSVAVPWYWQFLPIPDDAMVLGMPNWAFGATVGSLSVSLFSAWILMRRWPCEEADDEQLAVGELDARQLDEQQGDTEEPVS